MGENRQKRKFHSLEMQKNILFIAPSYMDLYKDIIEEMQKQGYNVDYIPEVSFKDDPDNIRGNVKYGSFWVNKDKFKQKNSSRWKELLAKSEYSKVYDYLVVLDGQSVDSCVFDILKERNGNIYCVNYLFDTTYGVYKFQTNFDRFNKVFSFDPVDVKNYKLNFLPIYWVPCSYDEKYHYGVFGLGALSQSRYRLFDKLEGICKEKGISYYLKLLSNMKIGNTYLYSIRCLYRKIIGQGKNNIPLSTYHSHLVTNQGLAPALFRVYIASADVVIDTSAAHQHGMTARFMWALGTGKRIITSNQEVKNTEFMSDRIFIYTESSQDSELMDFISSSESSSEKETAFEEYRIDNWLKTILEG